MRQGFIPLLIAALLGGAACSKGVATSPGPVRDSGGSPGLDAPSPSPPDATDGFAWPDVGGADDAGSDARDAAVDLGGEVGDAAPDARRDAAPPDAIPDSQIPDAPAPDTLPPDTLPPDTLPPDTLPPDTLPPDTLPPDTLPPDTLPPDSRRPVAGERCATARRITLGATGSVRVTGTTAGARDEFPTLRCGGTIRLDGPQIYYRLAVVAGVRYRIALTSTFAGHVYVFGSAARCKQAAIETDCSSRGRTGVVGGPTRPATPLEVRFTPAATGDILIAVDSASPALAGAFVLDIRVDCSALDGACTRGVWSGGRCVRQNRTGTCDDGNACTVSDTCSAGVCRGLAVDCTRYDSACTRGICRGGVCQRVSIAGKCNDGNACTTGDTCRSGTCRGTPIDCSRYSDTCNLGTCTAGRCRRVPRKGTIACSDGLTCTTRDVCVLGVCKGVARTDGLEPNDTFPGRAFAGINDCTKTVSSTRANLYPATDLDWYWLPHKDTDTFLCDTEPYVELTAPAGSSYKVCLYYACDNGETPDFKCKDGKLTTGGPGGSSGCCATTSATLRTVKVRLLLHTIFGCGADFIIPKSQTGKAYFRITRSGGSATCTDYTLKWGDDS